MNEQPVPLGERGSLAPPPSPPATVPRPKRPYVGVRPLNIDESALLFGRDDDVRFLCNKIFASPITLLYAQSGIGKSSLLRARVLAALKEQDAIVVYFENWNKTDPESVLYPLHAELAAHLPAEARTPSDEQKSLAELVRLLGAEDEFGDRHTVVLIVDQLEEFLLQAADIETLRRELAVLLRDETLDVRVVLSLREEFLAALEPFKSAIPNLFRSTYRLAPLDEQALLDAIREPVTWFGGECEPGLAEKIVLDLAATNAPKREAPAQSKGWKRVLSWLSRPRAPEAEPADPERPAPQEPLARTSGGSSLPFIQLVCEKLWARAEGGDAKMSIALYNALGGVRKILEAHVQSVAPKKWTERELLARLLVPLAPATGLKMSYAPAELAQITARDAVAIGAVLQPLATQHILRSREYGGNVRYEVQHDALIQVLGPWRDEVLATARQRKTLQRLGLVLLLTLAGTVYGIVQHTRAESEYRRNTSEQLKQGPERGPGPDDSTLERVAAYLLLYSNMPKERRFTDLETLLGQSRQKPYGMAPRDQPPSVGSETLLRVSNDYPLQEDPFGREWAALSARAGERWGLPLPARIRVEKNLPLCVDDGGKKRCQLILNAPGGHLKLPFEWDAGWRDLALVPPAAGGVAGDLKAWLGAQGHWQARTIKGGLDGPEEWWAVPRWSLPAWGALGTLGSGAIEPSAFVARQLAAAALEQPELFLTRAVSEAMLAQVSNTMPVTVREVRRARDQRLVDDLIALVKHGGYSLAGLPAVLDYMAAFRQTDSSEVVAQTWDNLPLPAAYAPSALTTASASPCGPKGVGLGRPQESASAEGRAANVGLPEFANGLAVYIGSSVRGGPASQLDSIARQFTRSTYEARGLSVPVSFVPRRDLLTPVQVALLVADGSRGSAGRSLSSRDLADPSAFKQLLEAETERTASLWITAESVQAALDRLNAAPGTSLHVGAWLTQKYSLTDLKLLLRAVANGSGPGQSARYPEWLLASLVYFSPAASSAPPSSADLQTLARRLQALQKAADEHAKGKDSEDCSGLDKGIALLRSGDACGAEQEFSNAKSGSEECFVRAFARSRTLMTSPPTVTANQPAQTPASGAAAPTGVPAPPTLVELLAWKDLISNLPASAASALTSRMWLFERLSFDPPSQAELFHETLERLPKAEQWPIAATTVDFFRLALDSIEPTKPEQLEIAKAALGHVLAKNKPVLHSDPVGGALDRLLRRCNGPLGANWCRGLILDVLEQHARDVDPSTLVVAIYELLWRDKELIGWYGDKRMLEQAVGLAETAAKGFGNVREVAEYERVVARDVLQQLRDSKADAARTRASLARFRGHEAFGRDATLRLAALEAGEPAAAAAKPEPLAPGAPLDVQLTTLRYFANLANGRYDQAVRDAGLLKKAPDVPPTALLAAALSEVLFETTERGAIDRYLATKDEQAPLVAALAVNRRPDLREEMSDVLSTMVDASPGTERPARLDDGAVLAWQRLLIDLFLGRSPWQERFGPLFDDKQFAESPFRFLGRERRGLLCQARLFQALALEHASGATPERKAENVRQALDAVAATGMKRYVEFHVAACLLDENCRPADQRATSRSP